MAASMSKVWNCEVTSPPVASCSYDCYDIEEVDVYKLKTALEVLQSSSALGVRLASEQYTLSRLLYKSNNQQRRWRWYQMLNKIQKCLSKLQSTHPATFIEDAVCCCQIIHNDSCSTIHLPSRQMLEYILIKLMGQAKLCVYLLSMAESVYIFVVQNITCGLFLPHNMIYASIVSRIWVMMRAMLNDMILWYSTLRPWWDQLKATSMQWMVREETFPLSLLELLKPDYDPVRYSEAIICRKRPSKKKASTLLDNMFASNHEATDGLKKGPEKDGDSIGVAMATETPLLDLGRPVTVEEVAQKRSKAKVKRKQSETHPLQEPATKKSRVEVETYAMNQPNGNHSSGVLSDNSLEKRMNETKHKIHENEIAVVDNASDVSHTGKKLKKFLKQGIKKKLKQIVKKEEGENVGNVRTPNNKANKKDKEDVLISLSQSRHPQKAKNRFDSLKAKIQAVKKTKKSQGRCEEIELGDLSGDIRQKQSQQTKEIKKQHNQKNFILKNLKKKKNKEIGRPLQEGDSPSPSKVNSKTKKKMMKLDTRIGSSFNDVKKQQKKKKVTASSLVCELGKISRGEPKTLLSRKSDIDDIFSCLE